MPPLSIDRCIVLQEQTNPRFASELSSALGAEGLSRCIQCGTCSGTCPLSIYMDHTPRQIIAMTRAGFEDEVLSSNTIWLCASCYACTVHCPKQIKVTDIMYALKRRAIRKRVYPRRFPTPVLAREFIRSVRRTGRSNEARTVARMMAKTRPLGIFRNARLGLRLMKRGRMSFRRESMGAGAEQVRLMLDQLEASGTRQTSSPGGPVR